MPAQIRILISDAEYKKAYARLDPKRLHQRASGAMNEWLHRLVVLVRARTPVDTGTLRGSIVPELRGATIAHLSGRVYSPLDYAPAVEDGRRPGMAPPPTSVIQRWAGRRLADGSRGTAYVIARAIGRRGIPGRHMFRDAGIQGRTLVDAIFDRWFGGL